jgi:AraC-like DNA-binding protein
MGSIMALFIYILGYVYILKYRPVISVYTGRVAKLQQTSKELEAKKAILLERLTQEKLYQDPSLTVAKLAVHLGWPINQLSSVINELLQTTFSDLINRHRVAAFQRLALEPESKKYSILGLGKEVGFSSKASFYRVFKKETGMTPTDFMKGKE